jgi:hypothetical protein
MYDVRFERFAKNENDCYIILINYPKFAPLAKIR